jgi:hypothetical protein
MTTLNLLTREGLVTCSFDRPLKEEQYLELFSIVHDAETKAEMKQGIEEFARRFELKVLWD